MSVFWAADMPLMHIACGGKRQLTEVDALGVLWWVGELGLDTIQYPNLNFC